MTDKQVRDAHYWGPRLREDKEKLDGRSKLNLIRALLIHTTPLSQEEVDLFLAPKEVLSNPDRVMQYAILERKIAEIFGGTYSDSWEKREAYLVDLRNSLRDTYTSSELDEIQVHVKHNRDANALTMWLAGDHYGLRRIRNAYLPEITDLIEIDTETGNSRDLTASLFVEGSEDAVSRIERILVVK